MSECGPLASGYIKAWQLCICSHLMLWKQLQYVSQITLKSWTTLLTTDNMPLLCSTDDLRLTLTFFTARSNLLPYACRYSVCVKSNFREIFLKLATNGQSDKAFLLTSKFWTKYCSQYEHNLCKWVKFQTRISWQPLYVLNFNMKTVFETVEWLLSDQHITKNLYNIANYFEFLHVQILCKWANFVIFRLNIH